MFPIDCWPLAATSSSHVDTETPTLSSVSTGSTTTSRTELHGKGGGVTAGKADRASALKADPTPNSRPPIRDRLDPVPAQQELSRHVHCQRVVASLATWPPE